METTFITIHDLTQDARIRYASASIVEVLGYAPNEVVNKSCWEYFHPDEIPFARSIHGRGVEMDKAAVLNYCLIRHKSGSWVGCECVFTVVYDVLVACTSIYQRGNRSQKRAADAPIVRKLFTSSPRDPRYHMLSYISNKFSVGPSDLPHEPRAALFVNRFTRTATIMHATNGVNEILGISPRHLVTKSFYYCIQERCLSDAVRCLESAKANNSIAYLRFWYRNLLEGDGQPVDEARTSETGTHQNHPSTASDASGNTASAAGDMAGEAGRSPSPELELEAVVSCTSDGLVVILRRARPFAPDFLPAQDTPTYANGLFASPWAIEPVYSQPDPLYATQEARYPHSINQIAYYPGEQQSRLTGAPSYMTSSFSDVAPSAARSARSGPGSSLHSQLLLNTIREVAVFAWGIIGINNKLERFKRGNPKGESLPHNEFYSTDASGFAR